MNHHRIFNMGSGELHINRPNMLKLKLLTMMLIRLKMLIKSIIVITFHQLSNKYNIKISSEVQKDLISPHKNI